jgi:hypothetical protein
LEGDHEAGREALTLCRTQLAARSLSPTLADYLAARLHDVLEGIKPDRILTSDDFRQSLLNALRINKDPGKPLNPFPEWEQPLGAVAALLLQRGYKPTQINVAMSDARQKNQSKDLDAKEALRIRKTYAPMQNLGADDLMRLAGIYGEILKEYPPCK